MSNKKNAQITAHFTIDDQQAILALASEEGVTASEWIRNLVTTHLEQERSRVIRLVDVLGVRKTLRARNLRISNGGSSSPLMRNDLSQLLVL